MKLLIQRVTSAEIIINNESYSQIGHGILIYLCLENGDETIDVNPITNKILKLRIFNDDQGKLSKCVSDIQGSIMLVSQFTLSWNGKKGNRPSFDKSMTPQKASLLYKKFVLNFKESISTKTGQFGADMKVNSVNDGPVTFMLDF